MQKDILYPDLTPDQWKNYFRGGTPQNLRTTEIYRSGGAPIEQTTGRIVVRGTESLTHSELRTSGQYPAQFRNEEFWEPNFEGLEITDSVVSGRRSNANNEIFNPYDDIHDPQDLSVYRRYMFDQGAFDNKLPVYKQKDQILRRISTYPIVVIEGETGCGKTTQIPQSILHDAKTKNEYCNIIVTQPRRIAAISVTRQVCSANKWIYEPPGICGYQIGSEKRHCSDDTRLLYCTTGVVLRKLMSALKHRGDPPNMRGHFTHIILDEVHERDREMDLLMLLVKMYRAHFPTVKVILMSATIQTKKTAEYFSTSGANKISVPAPILTIEGRVHEVKEWYLDDLSGMMRSKKPRLDITEPQLNQDCIEICGQIIENFSKMECGGTMGAVLVFLPGMQEIKTVHFELSHRLNNLELITLHSEISVEEQRKAFMPAPQGRRKVILSTNIGESSITVPDVAYVIDFCLNKVLFTDHSSSHLECLRTCWASKANCRQRAGRAGRVMEGRCYRLIERSMYAELAEFPQPEILRASLCQTVLQVKLLDLGPPRSVLANAIDPPNERQINTAVQICKEVQALTTPQIDAAQDDRLSHEEKLQRAEGHSFDGDLTYLGEILANLPLDVRLGKLIIFGHMFGVVEACVIIAASLTVKSFFFKQSYDREFEYHMSRLIYASHQKSDPLANLFAYEAMENIRPNDMRQRGIHRGRLEEVRYLVEDLKNRLSRFGIDFRDWTENLPEEKRKLRYEHRTFLIRLAIAAAFYPNYFLSSKPCDTELLRRELAGRNHLTTVQVSNLPQNYGFFYHDKLVKIFQRCLHDPDQHLRIFYEQSKAYVEFIDPYRPPDDFSDCVYLAVRMRMLRNETIPKIIPYNDSALQRERERLLAEAREFYRSRNQLTPTLIMITDDSSNPRSRSDANYDQPIPENRLLVNEQPTAALLSASSTDRYALPGETTQCAKIEITYVLSCCRFFARFIPINDVESDYSKIRLALFDSSKLNPMKIASLTVGEMYVALHPNPFFNYQRAKLESYLFDEEKVRVLFVDIGEPCDVGVDFLFECPPSILNLRYQAVECRLAKLYEKPSAYDLGRKKLACNQFEMSDTGESRLKQFDVVLYSVVDSVVALDLKAKNPQSGATFSVGSMFVERNLANPMEETPESLADHKIRSRRWGIHPDSIDERNGDQQVDGNCWPLRFSSIILPVNEPSFDQQIILRIANQPSEYSFSSPVYGYGEQTRIKVTSDSVNCIALQQFPTATSPSLLVAASAAKDDRSGCISLSDTTLYPPEPGLPPIISMLFAAVVELIKGKKQQEYPIGILCGLGPDPSSMEPILSEHDSYLTLDTQLTEDDLVMINSIRRGINLMINRDNPVIMQSTTQFRHTQQTMIEALISLLAVRKRTPIEPEYPEAHYIKWALRDTSKRSPQNALRDISLKMHDGRDARNATFAFQGAAAQAHLPSATSEAPLEVGSMHELMRNRNELQKLLADNVEFTSAHCMICNLDVHSLRHLRVHLAASNHLGREKLLQSRIAAETAGQRANQNRPDAGASVQGCPVPSTASLMAAKQPQYFYQADESVDWPW